RRTAIRSESWTTVASSTVRPTAEAAATADCTARGMSDAFTVASSPGSRATSRQPLALTTAGWPPQGEDSVPPWRGRCSGELQPASDPKVRKLTESVHLALHNTNPSPLVEGPTLEL